MDCKEDSIAQIDAFVKKQFPNAKIVEEFGSGGRQYDVGPLESLASAFSIMEEHKDHLGIHSYSLTQATLEQVFLHFASQQKVHDVVWGDR